MYKWAQFLLASTLLLLTSPVIASDNHVSIGNWHASGSELWRTAFPLHTTLVDGASELYYPHSGNYVVANYENSISPKYSLAIEGGIITNTSSNIGSDSDWDKTLSKELWYYGQFNTKSKGGYITIDWQQHTSNNTSLFYGYTYNITHYSMTNGLYSIINYGAVNEPLPTLNSHYTMVYQGPHVGIIHKVPLTNKLTAIGSLSYSPWALAQGHGWWNLRNLNFEHVGSAQMLDTKIGLSFTPKPQTTIILGYRYQYFKLIKGWENISADISWDKATTIRRGYYLTGEKRF
ncbi:MAG: hypothetical protein H6Q68_1664 [Firmicutes bacterium]|nr:hypothetical protein [Bacillota bacterium]